MKALEFMKALRRDTHGQEDEIDEAITELKLVIKECDKSKTNESTLKWQNRAMSRVIKKLELIIKDKDVIIESMAQGKSLPKYEAKFNCLNCGTSLKVVDMETEVTREECPFCGYIQLVKSNVK